MKKTGVLILAAMAAAPTMAAAQIADSSDFGQLQQLLINILEFANTVLIPFIIGIGFLFFVWGMFRYFIAGGANEEKREQGKSLLIYATLGFVMIIIFFGVVNLITTSIGLEGETLKNVPSAVFEPEEEAEDDEDTTNEPRQPGVSK